MKGKTLGKYTQLALIVAIIFVVNIIANFFHAEFDLTEDKRFTLSDNTKQLVSEVDDNVNIRILLDGEFPAGFKRLQSAVKDMMDKIRDANPNIIYEFEDPSEGSSALVERRRKQLIEDKIVPINLSYSDGTQLVQKAVFPFAIIHYKTKKYIVNLLEEQKPGDDEDIILNKSIALLEYKFANAFSQMQSNRIKNILFTQGNGELDESQTFRLTSELRKFHRIGYVSLDTLMRLDSTIDLMIVASPKTSFSIQNLFKLDQYVMQGGKVIWLIDKFDVSLDSINKYRYYVPTESEIGVEEALFKYGVRIMPDLIMDLECSQIPQVVGMAGDKPQTKLFPWPYHLAAASTSTHPIVKNIDRVNLFFPSTIDTIKTSVPLKKTVLLSSSVYSRSQLSPVRLSFEMLKVAPDPQKYNDGKRPVSVLVEGEFESFFKNRLTPEFQAVLDNIKIDFIEKGKKGKQIVVSDADFAKNLVNTTTGVTEDIGYNKWERRYYKGNKDFILNAIEYMLDEGNILEARSKEIKLRLLDSVKTREERFKWQMINVLLPVVILILFGILYQYFRKRKYARFQN